MTFQTVAQAIGVSSVIDSLYQEANAQQQDNVKQFNSNLRVLCLGPDNAQQAQWGLCQFV